MSNLQGLVAFAETVNSGSFAAAARALGLSPSAVAKAVARLEASLGLRLLHRTTRQASLTSDGRALHERCRHIVDDLDALRAQAEGVRGEPAGTLRLNVPIAFGKEVVVPILAALAARHPRLALDVTFSDRYEDIVRAGYDAAVRVGDLADSTLVARPFATQQMLVCAAPAYLRAHGTPRRPDDLAKARCLAFRMASSGRLRPWDFLRDGRPCVVMPPATFVLDDGEALVAAAVAGMGVVQVPRHMAQAHLDAGRLTELLPRFRPAGIPVSLVYPTSRQVTPRLRVLMEALLGTPAPRRASSRRASR